MGSNCCKGSVSDVYSANHCGRCRRKKAVNKNASKMCKECNEKLCEACVEKHKHCCCSRCCYGCEESRCWLCCICKRTKSHSIEDILLDISFTPPPKPPKRVDKATSPRQRTPTAPSPPPTTRKLTPVEKRTFKVDGEECSVTAFDVLPNGYFVIADRRHSGWLYIFDTANRMRCKLYAGTSNTSVLDVAALDNHRLAYIDNCTHRVLHFVQIGERYRHMERQAQIQIGLHCRRIHCYNSHIFVVGSQTWQSITTESFILVLDTNGVQISHIQCHDFCINALTCTVSPGNTYIYVTDIIRGIRCYKKTNGNFTAAHPDYRDIDVQWYYGITSDKLGNVFVCTQDECGPEVYELELAVYDPTKVVEMNLHLSKSDGLETPTTIRYNYQLDVFVVGSFEISFENYLYEDNADASADGALWMRGRHDREGSDRQTHALMNSCCGSTTFGVYKLDNYYDYHTVRPTDPFDTLFDNRRKPYKLVPVGKMSFKVDDKECFVSGYDILPRGETDILPSGKIVVVDARQKLICIFGPLAIPRNILHCKMRVDRYMVLDVATLTDRRLVFVADNKNAIYFVVAGKRFRHMEIEKIEKTVWNGRRVCYFGDKIYIVGMNAMKTRTFIEIFSVDGQTNLLPVMTLDCGEFHFVTSIAVNASYIFVTSVSAGIRVYDHAGNLLTNYRDIDVQWYYGVAKDKYDNWFVCTQDELGPEIYEIKGDNFRQLVRGLTLHTTAREGLEPPLMLCYNPRLDLLMVGSNYCKEQDSRLRQLREASKELDPYLIEKEAREKHQLEDASWLTRDCDLYKIEYKV